MLCLPSIFVWVRKKKCCWKIGPFFLFVLNHAADGIFFSYIWLEEFLKNQLKKSIWSLSAHPHPHPDERSSDVSQSETFLDLHSKTLHRSPEQLKEQNIKNK